MALQAMAISPALPYDSTGSPPRLLRAALSVTGMSGK